MAEPVKDPKRSPGVQSGVGREIAALRSLKHVLAAMKDEKQNFDEPRDQNVTRGLGDRVFRSMSLASGLISFLIVGGTLVYLATYAYPALRLAGLDFVTTSLWAPDSQTFQAGILGLLTGTVLIAVVAISLGFPVSFALALFIHEYAPRRMRRPMVYIVDLMAAMPSLIYGLWGFFVLQKPLKGISHWLGTNISAIPLFRTAEDYSGSIFVGGVVVSIMITPICTAVMREIFSQVPSEHCEAALALGGTRWGMVKTAILPFSRSGMVGSALLGLGRALGETIAVLLIVPLIFQPKLGVLGLGGGSVAAGIAGGFGVTDRGDRSWMGAGLVLFLVTLLVNMAAQRIVKRSRKT
jgi:phosphate transport system permease protein